MKVLITGIGCIGKSTLREKLDSDFPDKVISVDMDYDKQIPSDESKVIIVESVHGLEINPEIYDRILYLMPPVCHTVLWLRRGWAWFASGIVDLSASKGKRKRFAVSNIPIIIKILARNIYRKTCWIRDDLRFIQKDLGDRTYSTSSMDEGYRKIKFWIMNDIIPDNLLNMGETR